MPTTVYDIVEIELSNGDSIALRPLPIKQMKRFMDLIQSANKENAEETEEQVMDLFIKGAMLCLEVLKPEYSKDRDKFEEIIEVPTMMKILEIAGGLKLDDPNLLGAALVGTN